MYIADSKVWNNCKGYYMKENEKRSIAGAFCHIYYPDLVGECMEYLTCIPKEHDLYMGEL